MKVFLFLFIIIIIIIIIIIGDRVSLYGQASLKLTKILQPEHTEC
jgi:hypothetical protein